MTGSIFVSSCSLIISRPHVNLSQRLKQTQAFNQFSVLVSTNNNNIGFSNFQHQRRSFHYIGTTMKARKDFIVFSKIHGSPLPSGPPPSSWKSWAIGIVLTLVLPFFTHKWGPLLPIKKEIDMVVQTAEQIVDVVEIVAEKVEKVAEGIAHDLPEGGALRNTVDFVEDVAENIAKDAHLAAQFIDKMLGPDHIRFLINFLGLVQNIEMDHADMQVEEMEGKLESFMEPAIHQTKEVAEEAIEQLEIGPNEENKEL